ncbi:MAG TPA: ATP-dependent DNA helicase [Candidatus Competibacter sp.]|nr:ATP-dependent helicase [Candidatus Competibacteraceae bacterium]HPE71637.1 ATP-dependent DNA helicase [Candidatus Competibacter sp.]HRW66487.1 ATP-dependent DNA helicase [Candidatus Competibacter sp.]
MSIDQVLRNKLTPQQYAGAVDTTQEVLCLACAGSGKSRTLAYRIARLLVEGNPPESIVAFTFTEKAAESIKRRVSEALLTAGLDPTVMGAMYIGTIHAYCQHVLGDMDATYRQFDVLDENRLKLYLISRYADLGLHSFQRRARGATATKPGGYFDTIKQVSDAWKTANDELLNLDQVSAEDRELGELLIHLRRRLLNDQYIDFSMMIRSVVEGLQSNNPVAEAAIESLRHLMCDEYQDVNPCQEELIRLLHDRSVTLFVVGDDDQSIYAWRGADVSNILQFQQRYPNCAVHTLAQNFRSTEPIIQASDAFVAATLGPSRISKNPVAVHNRRPQDFRVLWFPDRPTEAAWVAERIQALLGTAYEDADGTVRGLTPADFAILMRSTRQEEQDSNPRHAAFTSALDLLHIPFSLEAGGGPFDRSQVNVLRSTFELLRNASPDRNTVQQHFNNIIKPAYPHADFNAIVRVLTQWGQRIHRPTGSTRLRLYPQQFVYDLLGSFNVAQSNFTSDVMRDIGLFSRMILDVETVYMSVDSRARFSEVLNFLSNAANTGYDVSTDDLIQRPDAVTVATVHKMKGLEFPCVFVVDAEARRFPKKRSQYSGWLPAGAMANAINRGAYQSTPEEEARLFYTAITRAERYLYITAAANLPAARALGRQSPYSLQLVNHPSVDQDPNGLPANLANAPQRRRIEDTDYPTSFTEVRYYLQCPKSYQFRERFGLNPTVPAMFGYGRTVHTSIQKLHERFPDSVPGLPDAEQAVKDTFHLKHVPQSNDPVNRPGGYERARNSAVEIAKKYVEDHGPDFEQERTLEATFEIPAANCVITGAIDLLLREDAKGHIVDAAIVDFKAMEGKENPEENEDLDWTELSLQVQLYAHAAEQVLGENARTGSVHLLKDNQRIEVPITQDAVDAALANIKWAVQGILASDFPMRPHHKKCVKCDFSIICLRTPQDFASQTPAPPPLHLPGATTEMARAFSLYQGSDDVG